MSGELTLLTGILYLFIFTIPVLMLSGIRASIDATKIYNGVYIGKLQHFKRAVIQLGIIVLISINCDLDYLTYNTDYHILYIGMGLHIIYMCSVFWLVFDLLLNRFRHLDYNYLPEPKEYTAFTDKMLYKYIGRKLLIPFKISIIIISASIYLYYLMSNNVYFTY